MLPKFVIERALVNAARSELELLFLCGCANNVRHRLTSILRARRLAWLRQAAITHTRTHANLIEINNCECAGRVGTESNVQPIQSA